MKLHEDKNLFRQAVAATAQQMGIPEIYIEKDYWVTFALKALFSDPIGEETIFKGGTALSKCFRLIDRFSEDIDLVVMRTESDSGNQLKEKLKRIGTVVSSRLPEIEISGLTRRMGMNRKTAHSYPNTFSGTSSQVRGTAIVVEATWLGSFEPYTTKELATYVADMMLAQGQAQLVERLELQSFEAKVLRPERTLCEKIMSLVRFSYGDDPARDLRLKVRHAYDLHKMLEDEAIHRFFLSTDFDSLLLTVARNDVVSYKNNNTWLIHPPQDALLFSGTKTVWKDLDATYREEFSKLVFGKLPPSNAIQRTLIAISKRLSEVPWNIQLPD